MAPRKRSGVSTIEPVLNRASASKTRKELEKDDSKIEIKTRRKSARKQITQSSADTKFASSPSDKPKHEESLKSSGNPGVKVMQSISINEMNVEQLLALGENSQEAGFSTRQIDDFEDSSDTSTSDFEEVQNADLNEPIIPKEGVDITLEVPSLHKKRQKKGFDIEAHLKRQINRVKKDLQLLMHKVHVLCWIAHLRFVNNILNNPDLMQSCASLVKSKNLYPSKYADLSYLEGILKYFHKNIVLLKEVIDDLCTGGIYKELKYQIEKKQVFSYKAYILIFIIFLRVLGLKTRIVMSFQVLPVKPSILELYGDIIKARSEKLKKAKEETEANNEANEKAEESQCQKNKKRKSDGNKPVGQKKKAKKEDTEVNLEANNSDDDFKSEHFKPIIKSKRNTKSKAKENEKSNTEFLPKKKGRRSKEDAKVQVKDDLDSDEEDSEFTIQSLKKKNNKNSEKKLESTSDESQNKKEGIDIWVEVYLEAEEKWISVDVPKQKIHCIGEIYAKATHPVTYVIACNNDHTLKDVTKRYVPHWHSDTRKRRVDEEWWNETMKPYLPPKTAQDKEEDEDINRQLLDKPMPSSISEFKDHPLYALKRHLLKFEAIYPPDAPTLGFVRGEPVYARECVHTLHSREMWYKQARLVRLKEEPYKVVKARPKYDKMTGEVKKDLPLELFGRWQTEDYIPPIATNGKVPRNEYGNVDLFQPCMLPIGTVHLQIPALIKIAKKLDIDCAPATVGFDFHSGGSHPVFDGFVVCEEFKDILLDAWNKEIDESSKKETEKREKRVYSNWKRLIRGLLIREKLKIKYAFGGNSDEESNSKSPAVKASTSSKLI